MLVSTCLSESNCWGECLFCEKVVVEAIFPKSSVLTGSACEATLEQKKKKVCKKVERR